MKPIEERIDNAEAELSWLFPFVMGMATMLVVLMYMGVVK